MSKIKLYYFEHPKDHPNKYNFGDLLSRLIVEKITGLGVAHSSPKDAELFAIGSVMAAIPQAEKAAVWGTGVMFEQNYYKNLPNIEILALRGKLTAERMPEAADIALGDPALLSSRYFKKSWRKKYRLGIVPHYVDKGHELAEFAKNNRDILLIDVFDTPQNVLKQISSCRAVVSSSLHGIIVAHSYGVPAAWVELSDKVAGSGFKFRDYYSVFGRKPDRVNIDEVRTGSYSHVVWTPSKEQLQQLTTPLEEALRRYYEL